MVKNNDGAHIFTRRTYRVARRRAIENVCASRDLLEALFRKGLLAAVLVEAAEYKRLFRVAARIVERGRAEKGMWGRPA